MKRIKKNKWKTIFVSTLVVLIVSYGGYCYYKTNKPDSSNSTFEIRTVEEMTESYTKPNLTLSGEVIAKNSQKIKIDSTKGQVKDIKVREGDTIKNGQELFSYATEQQLKAKEATYSKEEKERQLQAARTTASLKWESYNKKATELEELKTKRNNSTDEEEKKALSQEIKTLENDIEMKYSEALSGDNDIVTAEAELKKLTEFEKVEQERLSYDVVTSDGEGKVTYINQELPKLSQEKKQEETFMEIVDQTELYVTGKVNEFDREKVELNKQVELVDRKNPSIRWKGKVVQIANLGSDGDNKKQEDNPNVTKYPYKILLEKSDKMPIIGTHVYANFLSNDEDAGKMIVEKKFLFDIKGKTASVWKVTHGKATKEVIEFKEKNNDAVEVTKNMTMADRLVNPTSEVKEGVEIK